MIQRYVGDHHAEAQVSCNLGSVYLQQECWQQATECYQKSLEITRSLEDPHMEGLILANLGNLHKEQQQIEQARILWQQALTKLHYDSPEFKNLSKQLNNL